MRRKGKFGQRKSIKKVVLILCSTFYFLVVLTWIGGGKDQKEVFVTFVEYKKSN